MKRLLVSVSVRAPIDSSLGWLRTETVSGAARFVIVTFRGRSTAISRRAQRSSSARATPSSTS